MKLSEHLRAYEFTPKLGEILHNCETTTRIIRKLLYDKNLPNWMTIVARIAQKLNEEQVR